MESKFCIVCNKEFIPTYSKQQCCSKSCAAALKAEKQKAKRITKYCEICGKEMRLSAAHSQQRYCSRECTNKGRTTLIKKICEICGAEFEVIRSREHSAKYCSTKCLTESLKGKNNCICAQCGRPFHLKPYHLLNYGHSFGNYCSVKCLTEARKNLMIGEKNHQYGLKGPLNASFKGQEITLQNHKLTEIMVYIPDHPYANKTGRVKKHRIVVEQNYERFDLKYFDVINGIHYLKPNIHVHHIDGNHNNNSIENLTPCTRKEHRIYHRELKAKNKAINVETAVLKQGELLGSPEVDNQQPSAPLTKCEGSETRC